MTVLLNNIINLTVRRVEDHLKDMKAALAAGGTGEEVELDLAAIVHDLEAFMMLSVDCILGLEDATGPGTPEASRTTPPPPSSAEEGSTEETKTGQYL